MRLHTFYVFVIPLHPIDVQVFVTLQWSHFFWLFFDIQDDTPPTLCKKALFWIILLYFKYWLIAFFDRIPQLCNQLLTFLAIASFFVFLLVALYPFFHFSPVFLFSPFVLFSLLRQELFAPLFTFKSSYFVRHRPDGRLLFCRVQLSPTLDRTGKLSKIFPGFRCVRFFPKLFLQLAEDLIFHNKIESVTFFLQLFLLFLMLCGSLLCDWCSWHVCFCSGCWCLGFN